MSDNDPELSEVGQHEERMEEMYARLDDVTDYDGVDLLIDRVNDV